MGAHCGHHNESFDGASAGFRRALLIVIAINAAMFLVELTAGALAGSQALQADALDFLGDTATYAISLMVLGHSLKRRATVALVKGVSLAGMGLWVLGSTAWQILVLEVPRAEIMGCVGMLALAANVASVLVLMSYRNGDANVRSVWLCSRNDAIGNVIVMAAAGGVWASGSAWPDLLVAAAMASLFLWSAWQIVRLAVQERRQAVAMPLAAE